MLRILANAHGAIGNAARQRELLARAVRESRACRAQRRMLDLCYFEARVLGVLAEE